MVTPQNVILFIFVFINIEEILNTESLRANFVVMKCL